MEEQDKAEVVTIKEAVDKVKSWLTEKDFEKAKQGCEEILSVEKDNAEVKEILEKINSELGIKSELKPEMASIKPEEKIATEPVTAPITTPLTTKKSGKSNKGLIILTISLVLITGGLVLSFIMGWLNPVFERILGLLGM